MTHWVLKTVYIRKIAFFVAAIAVLSGCSDNSTKEISGIDTKGQPWTITLAEQPEPLRLPETQTMKLLGGDLSAYIKEKCEPLWLSERCDVYAQADPTGALIGYLTVVKTGDNGFSYETDTLTNQNQACLLGGRLEDIQGDVNGDFSARSPFQYVGEGRDAGGMIYLKKRGSNLQLTDERWNYCYSDRHIDDIYVFVGSLVRSAPKAAVKADVEIWECDFDSPPFTVALSANSYKFAPYNPDGGQLQGAVRVLEEGGRGLTVTNLELVGSGAPEGRWSFVQDRGKRRALMAYAVESSGDGSECTPPGQAPQYEFN